jgi:beta-glucanase (GH16 family)
VRVTVSESSKATNDVSLKIGRAAPHVVAVRRHAAATVTADVKAAGSYGEHRGGHLHFHSVLTVRARGSRARPQMTIKFAKIAATKPASSTHGSTAGASGSSSPPSGPLVPTGDSGTWNLIFDDEFNGSSLNTADWSTGWFGSGITGGVQGTGEPECYDPSHVVEGNGELDLNFTQESETCDGKSEPYTSGMVTSDNKFSFSYGFIEVRAWLPTMPNGQAGDWPGVWLAGQDWPEDGEIDLAEGLGGSVCAHWHGPTGNGTGYGPGGTGCPSGTYTGGWHTFAADWEPGIVTWYYDGKDIGCIASSGSACGNPNNDSTITSSPMYIIFGLGSNAGSEYAPTSQRMDYVRVWQH